MSCPVLSTALTNRASSTLCRTRRCVYLTGLRKCCDVHRRIYDTRIHSRFVLGHSTRTAESHGFLSEAERLLEEQMRLLELEREESLSIAQQCATRSKRLMARLENLKDYSSKVAARRRGSSAAAAGQRNPNFKPSTTPLNTSRFQSPAEEFSARAAVTGTGSGAPAHQPMYNRQGTASSPPGLPWGPSFDPEEDQTRRLVSQALRRNISRGENNLALAEKLQQYMGLLRNELARVRRGDVSLAAKILEGHRVRTTAATATATATLPVPGADVGPSPQQDARPFESKSHPDGSAATVESGSPLQSRRAAAGRAAPAGMHPPQDGGGEAMAEKDRVSGDGGSGRGSSDASATLPAARPSMSPVAANHNPDIAANASPRRSETVGDTTSHTSSSGSSAAIGIGINRKAAGHDNEPINIDGMTRSSISGGDGCSTSRDGTRASGDGGPDVATGLGRIFSKSQVLELPGDETIPAAAAAGCEPSSSSETDLYPTSPKTKNPDAGRMDPDPDPDPDLGPPPDPARPPVPASDSSASISSVRVPSLTNPAPNPGSTESAGGSAGDAAGTEGVTPAISDGTASAVSGLGLGLEAARGLSRDSEDARSTLMGLLSPAGLLPGPLQEVASAGVKKGLIGGFEGRPDGHIGVGKVDAHVQQLETEYGSDGAARLPLPRRDGEVTAGTGPPQPRQDGLYSVRGEQVPSPTTRIQSPSAAAAAAKAAAIAAAAKTAAAAAAEYADGQGQKEDQGRCQSAAADEPELKVLVTLISVMVLELRRRGYMGCDEQVDLAAAQLERSLALARVTAVAAAPVSPQGR